MIKEKIKNWTKENKDEILLALYFSGALFSVSKISYAFGKQNGYLTAIGDIFASVDKFGKF